MDKKEVFNFSPGATVGLAMEFETIRFEINEHIFTTYSHSFAGRSRQRQHCERQCAIMFRPVFCSARWRQQLWHCNTIRYANSPELIITDLDSFPDLETFSEGKLWDGMTIYPITTNASIYNAFYTFANNATNDPDAALITAAAYVQGQYLFSNDYEYTKPIVNPPIFYEFTSIPNITSTMRITSLSDLTTELNASNPGGFRETYTTATFRNDPTLQVKILDIFVQEVDQIKDAKDLLPALVMQPVTKPMISHFSKKGGNALGIDAEDGPLICKSLLHTTGFQCSQEEWSCQ